MDSLNKFLEKNNVQNIGQVDKEVYDFSKEQQQQQLENKPWGRRPSTSRGSGSLSWPS